MTSDITVTSSKELVVASFRLHESGLDPIGQPTFEQWLACGDFINKSQEAIHFWIGDWLNYGERTWGERYKDALERTKYDYQTLRNDKWIASRIPPERRKKELSFSHHQEVADLPSEEQEELLHKAADEDMNRSDFRKLVESRKGENNTSKLSGRPDKLQLTHSILNANDAFVRQMELCDVTVLSDTDKSYLVGELLKTKQTVEQFLERLQ